MELIRCFKALSDKTRIRLFIILRTYELNVNEIVLVVGMGQSGVSRHLKILLESGLLSARKDGSFTYYSAARNRAADALGDLVRDHISRTPQAGQDLETAREMIQIRQSRTKRFFKQVAPQWDRLKKQVMGKFDLNRQMLSKIQTQGLVADLGCGTGELMAAASAGKIQNIIGVDSSPEMLDLARSRLAGKKNTELRLGAVEHLPMKNQEIDTAVMSMVLHHISQPGPALVEVFRVIKPGGRFILSDFEKHDNPEIRELMGGPWMGFEKQAVKDWLTQAGFQVTGLETHPVQQGLNLNIYTSEKS